MQPACEFTTARAELHQLRQLQETLSTELARHARQLKSVGALPPDELVDGLIAFRSRVIKLSETARLSPAAEVSLVDVHAALIRSETHDQVRGILSRILGLSHVDDPEFSALRDCQSQATEILTQLDAVTIGEPTAEITALLNGSHPFLALLQLVESAENLSDDDWTACHDRAAATWGRALATAVARGKLRATAAQQNLILIAVEPPVPIEDHSGIETLSGDAHVDENAIAHDSSINIHDHVGPGSTAIPADEVHSREVSAPRIKLIHDNTPPATTSHKLLAIEPEVEITPSDPAPAATPGDAVGWDVLDAEESVFDSHQDSIFDSIGHAASEQVPRRNARSLDLKLLSEDPYQWAKSQPIRTASSGVSAQAAGNVAILARRALQANAASRRSMMSQVTLQLLWDDRAALAYHLTRSSESHLRGEAYVLPSWVMRAMALSRHLCYSKGEIARLLEEDLKQFKPELLNTSSPEWNAGTGFFLRAAALIPALLASSPSAALILRSFRITPGLSHLYNYCSRVLTYGQQLNGQAADLFTPDCDLARWQGEIEALQQTVDSWLPETIKKHSLATRTSLLFLHAHWTLTASPTIRHPEAVRLWSKWQEVFRIVSRLLKPIRTGQETERNWVKTEIDRLTQSVRLESAAGEMTATVALGAVTFPQESMVAMIREAIDYASRWLRLCASKPAQGRTLASRDAELLRDEILDRTDSVITELAAYSRSHEAPRTKSGIACLCRTIEHLRAIFSPHSTLALRENDPRHVVSGELLKIPHLRFNEQWMPTVDPVTLETEVLSHLSHDQRDWRQAFEMQSAQHDHLATGRILELNVWRNEQEREALALRRLSEIDDCRQHLNAEVDSVAQHLAATIGKRILSDQVQASLEQRLHRIQTIAAQTVDFSDAQRELQGLRLAIDQRVRDAGQGARPARAAVRDSAQSPSDRPKRIDQTEPPPATSNGWAWDIFSDN